MPEIYLPLVCKWANEMLILYFKIWHMTLPSAHLDRKAKKQNKKKKTQQHFK